MIRCLAIDDEVYATKMIADYISKVPYFELAGVTNNALEGLNLVQTTQIDLVFLDIRMPELSGIQFLKLCGSKRKFILTTAYAEYALEGFEHDVVDYLLKPIELERFLKASQKAYAILSTPLAQEIDVPPALSPSARPDYLFIKGDGKHKFLKVDHDDILYIEGLKNYVSIYTATQRIVTYQTLRELEIQLPRPPFYRIHKSYIVPVNKVRMIEGHVLYIGNQMLPIGSTYRETFLNLIRKV
jgi:DNA-binding LytR/AlgR family response regulator